MPTIVSLDEPRAAFGALAVAQETPVVQIDAMYGLVSTDHETFTATGGSATSADSIFTVQTGTSVGGYGVIRSVRDAHYHAGTGMIARWTARYTAGIASSLQVSGPFTSENALQFGYNGATFGVLRRTGARLEIRTLTVSAGAGGSETATVTLNDVAFNVALTSGNVAHAVFQLAAATYTGWQAFAVGSTVVFLAQSTGSKAGAFTLSSTGTAAGTFARTRAGVTETDTWVAQSAWNIDPCNGSGPSRFLLDHTKFNVYQVQWQWLGAGAITFSIENPETGRLIPVHQIKYANGGTAPTVDNPTFKIGWVAASLGSTTNLTVQGISAGIFEENGQRVFLRNPRAAQAEKSSVGATTTNILSIRNNVVFADKTNFREVRPIRISVGSEGTGSAPVVIRVFLNATLSGAGGAADEPAWAYVDSATSCVATDSAAETITGGTLVAVINLSKTGKEVIYMAESGLQLDSNETLHITASTSSGSATVSASVSWVED